MSKLTKNQKVALSKIEAGKAYSLAEAVEKVKEVTYTKFDASLDIDVRLGVDPRKANQMVRGVVTLPHGTGKHAHSRLNSEAVQIRHFVCSNRLHLLPSDFTDFRTVRLLRAAFHLGHLFELDSHGGSLYNKVETLVRIVRDDYRQNFSGFILGAGIELLAKFHDIDALGTQRGTYGR